jgi:hypothetical protein
MSPAPDWLPTGLTSLGALVVRRFSGTEARCSECRLGRALQATRAASRTPSSKVSHPCQMITGLYHFFDTFRFIAGE